MSESKLRIGIDDQGASICVALVRQATGRASVESLQKVTSIDISSLALPEAAEIVCSVADDLVQVKTLFVDPRSQVSIIDQAKTELSQSVLESPERYCFDAIHTGVEGQCLGFITRKKHLEEIRLKGPEGVDMHAAPAAFRARGLALGLGFRSFCQASAADFVCVADFSGRAASICLLHGRNIVALARLDLADYDFRSADSTSKLAIEFKTLINFKLATLFEEGVNTPLTSLLLCGEHIRDQVVTTFGQYFPGLVSLTSLNFGYFKQTPDITQSEAGRFLVALGLTTDWTCDSRGRIVS